MMTWPDNLPFRPIKGTLSFRPDPNVTSFQPDVGDSYDHRRYPGRRLVYRGTLWLNPAQAEQLLDFFEDDCASGTLPFEMYDWRLLSAGTLQLKPFRWIGREPPEIKHVSGLIYHAPLSLSHSE
jgi:hypothetical protein